MKDGYRASFARIAERMKPYPMRIVNDRLDSSNLEYLPIARHPGCDPGVPVWVLVGQADSARACGADGGDCGRERVPSGGVETMSVAAAILILGAAGSASREIVVEPSIKRILVNVITGGVKDVIGKHESGGGGVGGLRMGNALAAWQEAEIRLSIDGQPRSGVIAWIAAAYRVAGYALDRRTEGTVEYQYRLRIRDFVVYRRTRISDGRVVLTTDVYGHVGPRGELYHVRLVINATEFRLGGSGAEPALAAKNATRITGIATGYSRIGERCRVVARIAGRQIADAMGRGLLDRIQAGGIDLYRAGSIAEVLR
jgi:hypothetical protein